MVGIVALMLSLMLLNQQPVLSQPAPGPGPGPGPNPGPQPSGSGVMCPVPSTKTTAAVSFSFTSSQLTIQSTQCPPYNWTLQSTGNVVQKACVTYTYPYPPRINAAGPLYIGVWKDLNQTITNALPVKNTIGMATNGVAIFSNTDGQNRDAYIYESSTFDQCLGHAQPEGLYHYHCEPANGCVYSDTTGVHSPLFGVMADGIPIYGHLGDNGLVPSDLDECNGHVDTTYPFYHYHLPNQTHGMHTYPYTVNCLRGCVTLGTLQEVTNVTCVPSSTTYDYTPFRTALSAFSTPNYNCSLGNLTSTRSSSSSSTGIYFSGAVLDRNAVNNWVSMVLASMMAIIAVAFIN